MENVIFIGVLVVLFLGTIAFLTRHDKPQEKKGE
jgi:hypothetical protein